MAAPSVSSITFDKALYAPGDVVTATVTYVHGTSASEQSFVGTATDSTTGLTGSLSVSFEVGDGTVDPTVVNVSDSGSRTWTPVSDSGAVAVFTAVA